MPMRPLIHSAVWDWRIMIYKRLRFGQAPVKGAPDPFKLPAASQLHDLAFGGRIAKCGGPRDL